MIYATGRLANYSQLLQIVIIIFRGISLPREKKIRKIAKIKLEKFKIIIKPKSSF
jgi:hypothetical protein